MQKKEFSQLPKKDAEMAFEKFENRQTSDEEKIKLTRDLLRKVYFSFGSHKLLNIRDKSPEWILKKHFSTKERFPYYKEVYRRVLTGLNKKISVIDLGAGVNGFSYSYFKQIGREVDYNAVEAVGQLVEITNYYFVKNNLVQKAEIHHLSLFELEKLKELVRKIKKPKVIFLLKVIDSLEMLKRDFSKELLKEITPLADLVVASFATRSLVRRERFAVSRKWILDFINKEFKILDDFEFGGERYIVFKPK